MSAQDAPESHRTKDADSLRVLFCIGVLPDFFAADAETQGALLAGIPAAFEDLGGRFGIEVIGTMDDDELMVGPSFPGPGPPTSSPTLPTSRPSPAVCDIMRSTRIGEDRLWRFMRIRRASGAGCSSATPDGRARHGAGRGSGARSPTHCTPPGTRWRSPTWTATRRTASPANWTRPGRTAAAWTLDVLERAAFVDVADAAEERLGPVGVLVNNAGLTIARPVLEIEADEWDEVLAVNLRGVLFGCQVLAPRMRERGTGRT